MLPSPDRARYKTIPDSPGGSDSWICFIRDDTRISFCLHIYTRLYVYLEVLRGLFLERFLLQQPPERHSVAKNLLKHLPIARMAGPQNKTRVSVLSPPSGTRARSSAGPGSSARGGASRHRDKPKPFCRQEKRVAECRAVSRGGEAKAGVRHAAAAGGLRAPGPGFSTSPCCFAPFSDHIISDG